MQTLSRPTHIKLSSPRSDRYCLEYDFGNLNKLTSARAIVLDQAIEQKRFFLSTNAHLHFSESGFLYIQDEDVLLRFHLEANLVEHIDVEKLKGWEIISYVDHGNSSTIRFKSYPHDEEIMAEFDFKPGYKKIRGAVLPSGNQIGIRHRKHILEHLNHHLTERTSGTKLY